MNMGTTPGIDNLMTVPEIAADAGVTIVTVHNWLKYHRYMPHQRTLGRPVVQRADYEKFKREHPELIGNQAAAA